jgi:molybdopterin converting factor small subunit
MPTIDINFVGPLRLFVGTRSVSIDVTNLEEARDYVERHFGPAFEKKLQSMGAQNKMSVWNTSNILLNGKNIQLLKTVKIEDGDRLDLISKVAGG